MSKVNRRELPWNTQVGDTVRKKRMRRLLDENPCIASPAAPQNLVMTFDTVERVKHDRIRAKCSFDSVTTDEDGFDLQVKIDHYVVEFQQAPTAEHGNDDWTDEPRRRVIDAVDPHWKPFASLASTDRFGVQRHGFRNGDEVQFRGKPLQIGDPIAIATRYFVVNVTDDNFQVSTTAGGAAVNLTSNGQGEVAFWVPHRYHVWFHNKLNKRRWYRFRVRAVAKGKNAQKSDWTLWEPPHGAQPVDTTPPPTPLLVRIHENSKDRVVVDWDDPPDADDSEIVDEDIAFYQVQLSTSPTFAAGGLYKFDRFQVASFRSWRIRDADQDETFYARVRSVDSSRNKSSWVPATLEPGNSNPATAAVGVLIGVTTTMKSPNTPSAPSVAFDAQGSRHAKYRAVVTAGTSTTDSTHDEAYRYIVQLAHSPTGPSSNPPAGTKRASGNVEGDATGDDLTETFRGIPKGHYVWVRERARNAGGASGWTSWVQAGRAKDSAATAPPGAVTGLSVDTSKPKRVVGDWDEPDDDETVRWKVTVKKSGVAVSGYPKYTRSNRHVYRVPSADVGVSHSMEVVAVSDTGTESGTGSGSGTPVSESVDGNDIAPGTLPTAAFASSIRPVAIVTSLPTGVPNTTYPIGSVVFLTSNNKLYRLIGTNNWTTVIYATDLGDQVQAGNLAANSVTAGKIAAGAVSASQISVSQLSAITANMGTLTAGSIFSSRFSTNDVLSQATNWIEIDGSSSGKDAVEFHSAGGTIYVRASGGGVRIGDGQSALIGFWGHTPVTQRTDPGDLAAGAGTTAIINRVNDILQILRSCGISG